MELATISKCDQRDAKGRICKKPYTHRFTYGYWPNVPVELQGQQATPCEFVAVSPSGK